ncbi:MAG: hypothetical protein JOZ51_28040 [Chloroflexi bacterium]|nr:hypothetical protein [Chloroflexota bacterium]
MNGTETVGIWINKRSLENFELPFRHNLQSKDAGWQIEVLEKGRLTVRFQSGRQTNYDVEAGDLMFSNGEEIYLTLQRSTKTTAAGTKSQRQAAPEQSSASAKTGD